MIELIQNSTIHGISHIYSASSKIIKLFWIFLFFFGIIGILVNIGFVVKKYLSNPVVISYTLDHENFIWPEITFCIPTAPYNFDNSAVYNHWKQVLESTKGIARNLSMETDVFNLIIGMNNNDFEFEERTVAMASADPQKLRVDNFLHHIIYIGYTKSTFGMTYYSDQSLNLASSITENLTKMFSTQIYQLLNNIPCYTFHLHKSELINPKHVTSLQILLNFKFDSYVIFNSSYYERSIFLYLNRKNELPKDSGIIIYPGFMNTLTVSQSRYYYNGRKRKCRNKNYPVELYDSLLQSTKLFEGNFIDCRKVESQKLFVKSCNCYSPFLPIYKNESGIPRICLNATLFSKEEILENANCMVKVYERFRKFKKPLSPKCSRYYPTKCNSISYKVDKVKELMLDLWTKASNDRRSQQIKGIYNNFYLNSKNNKEYRRILRDNMVDLIIKRDREYGDFYEEAYEYPFSELLSDIGGLMGLWLGMSVVGLFEIFELFYQYFKNICFKHQNNPQSGNFSETLESPT